MKVLRHKILVLFILASCSVFAQIDTEFWLAAPDISSEYGPAPGNGAPIRLHFTALYATTVTVTRPADPGFVPITVTLGDLEHKSIELNAIMLINEIETYPRALTDPSAIQNKGFHISAYPGEISCYYELDNKLNKDIIALKGANGLGKEFYVSTQNAFDNGDYKGTAWSGFALVATMDNTTVTVELNDDMLNFSPPSTVTITLNAGETYAFRSLYTEATRHVNGVRVTATNNIAITVYDDAMQKERITGGTSWDLFADQLVPLDVVGTEYIVMKGFVVDAPEDGGERIFVTATADNTEIFIDNNPVPVATINKGEVYSHPMINQATLVTSSELVYINHITGFEADLGGAILPPIGNCSGSYDVAFSRSPDPSENFYLNIMVKNITTPGDPLRNQAAKNFSIVSNGITTPIPESYFQYILDSTYAVLKRDPAVLSFITTCIEPGWAAMVRNPVTVFHLGVINGHINTGCKYGYFSDYKTINSSAGIGGALSDTKDSYCDLDPIRLVARGGSTYHWTGVCLSDPSVKVNISDPTISDPFFFPDTSGNYLFNVHMTQACGPPADLKLQVIVMYRPVANFEIDVQESCSPFTANITHHVDMSRVGRMEWYFDYPNATPFAIQDTLTNPFPLPFPENNTDSIIEYRIRLYTWAPFNACADHMERTVLIKPGVTADFAITDSAGCHPLPVDFNNLSSGHLDSYSFYWDFGDRLESYDSLPSHTYMNYSTNTVDYTAKLVVTSPFNCLDSITQKITVHPYIRGSLLVDSAGRCSPITSVLSPRNSIGVDTFFYSVQSPEYNDQFKRTTYDDLIISYTDTTYANGPDTIITSLIVQNRMGCSDTVPAKEIIVLPEVRTSLTIDGNTICDGSEVLFTNQSFGENSVFLWEFGDGSSAMDTLINSFGHTYFNFSDAPLDYRIILEGYNEYLCHDVADTIITVYPRVDAFFTTTGINNCSPLELRIDNYSHGADQYKWNYGDGSAIDYSADLMLFHTFVNPLPDRDTTYALRLDVVSPFGCKDSLTRNVHLLPQVVAGFTMSDTAGCSPSQIDFVNNSTGSNLVFNWQFGEQTLTNNDLSFEQTFNNYGAGDSTMNVVLTALNPQGCESSMTRTLTVYPYVRAFFGIDNMSGCSPLPVNTVNYSSPGSTHFNWTFNNGITSEDYEPSFNYVNNTEILVKDTIRLIAKNNHECYDTAVNTITVYPQIRADFAVSNMSGCQPLSVDFTNQTNIIANSTFYWDFGDGGFTNLAHPPTHIYRNLTNVSRLNEVHLGVRSPYGCYDDTTITIEVYPYIYANFTIDRTAICSDEPFTIDRSGSAGAINHYYWDYENDGITDEDKTIAVFARTYANTGSVDITRTINLTVTNQQGCDTSWSELITVHPQVRAAFSITNQEVCYPLVTSFTNLSEPSIPMTYYWDLGDGASSVSKDPAHAYKNFSRTSDRTYAVNLTATSEYGCDSSVSQTVTIHPKPLADFNYPLAADCPPFLVPFTNNSMGTSLEYNWNFDDGNISAVASPTNTFYNSGSVIDNRNVSLVVTTEFNCSDTVTKPVRIYPGVTVDFEASQWDGCNPSEINLDGTSFNENEYYWYVDGMVVSNYEDPLYRFVNETPTDKVFDVRFRAVSINGCTDDTVKQITIYPKPLAEFLPAPQVQEFNTTTDITPVTLNNLTNNQPIWSYEWDYGDGTNSNESAASFIKNYTIWGDIGNESRIPVSLTASNVNHPLCSDTVMHFIIIRPPRPRVDLGPDISGCMPLTVNFPSYTKYNYSDSYQWDFGYEGQTSVDGEPVPITYDTAGVYIVRLSVEGDGGTSWDYKTVTVHSKPKANFIFEPDSAWVRSETEPGTPIKFFNLSGPENRYTWDFDRENKDPATSNEYEPLHEYLEEGAYYVTLTAENEFGCTDEFQHEIPVIIYAGGIVEFPNAITIEPGHPASEYYNPEEPDPRIFRPHSRGIEKYKLEIYNRWGELIYESSDVYKGWNGYINGSPVKQDVYVWRVSVVFSNGRPYVKAGDVTVLVRKP